MGEAELKAWARQTVSLAFAVSNHPDDVSSSKNFSEANETIVRELWRMAIEDCEDIDGEIATIFARRVFDWLELYRELSTHS